MKDVKNKMSVSKKSSILLCAGFCFFLNPAPLGFDFIPDVFGCALIFFGLTQLAFFDGMLENAKKSIFYLFVVEAFKLLFMKSIATAEISSNRMLAVTAFSIIQSIIYIMFFKQFFGGIGYFSMRNNCNEALKKCDGTAFLSYLSFFVRIAATLLPELLALIEVRVYVETDFDIIDSMNDILSAKVVLVVLASLIALVTSAAWLISVISLLKTFFKESGEMLDQRYFSEYSSRPEMIRPKRLRAGSYAIYIALFFALDIVIDGIRFVPASAMFLILYIATFFFKDIHRFDRTRKFAPIAFLLLLGAEIFRVFLTPNGAVVIYETELWIVLVGAAICLVAVPCCMLCVRGFLADLRKLQKTLGGNEIQTNTAWISYCILATLWSAGFVVPYFYSYVSSLRFVAACVFIWQTARVVVQINDEEIERFSLYGKGD